MSIELADIETVNVDPAPNAGLTVGATLNPLCRVDRALLQFKLQLGVSYQLRNDAGNLDIGPPVAGTGLTINLPTGPKRNDNIQHPGDQRCLYTCRTYTGCTITVGGTLNAGLNLASSASPICEGSSTFIRVLLSENGVNYQLRNDANDNNVGIPVVGNGGTINLPTGNILATTTYNVVAGNGTCLLSS